MNTDKVIRLVAEEYGVTVSDIKGKRRMRPLPDARKMACFLLFSNGVSTKMVGKALNLDRSCIAIFSNQMVDYIRLYDDSKKHFENLLKHLLNEIKAHKEPTGWITSANLRRAKMRSF